MANSEPRGLFLRYCAPCNSTATVAERQGAKVVCGTCKGPLKIVDAFTLIPALGAKLDEGQRQAAVEGVAGHDLPST